MVEFREWPKIPRGDLKEIVTITEKIDGTNACIIVEKIARLDGQEVFEVVGAQSRTQLLAHNNIENEITRYNDNYGFAEWVIKHKAELAKLGEGYHYGEWAGEGIQKNPHNIKGKKFFLFNSERWKDERPSCCECVPILYEGPAFIGNQPHDDNLYSMIEYTMAVLHARASLEGYTPEGIVVWYHKSRRYEKYTFKNREGKWKTNGTE